MMRQLGGAFGLAIAVAVFTGAGSYASPHAFTDGFTAAIAVSATLSLVGALAGLAITSARRREDTIASRTAIPALEGEGS